MASDSKSYRVQDLMEVGVLEVGDGYRAKNSELAEYGLPFARVANINDGFHFTDADRFPIENLLRVGNKVSRPGDVVFTSKGTVGRFAYVTPHIEQFVYSPQLCFWRSVNPDVLDPRFLYFWMQGPEFMNQVEYLKGQTDMADYVSLRDQRRMKITVPPMKVQRGIVAVLGALEDRLFLTREVNETLIGIAEAIFRSWFIDFDPVRAKAKGQDPEGMDAETALLFPSEFEDSELGHIPRGWPLGMLGEIAQNPRTQANPDHLDPDTPYIGLEHMPRRSIALADQGKAEGLESNKFWFERRDILFGKLRPYFHKVGIAPCAGVCSTDMLVVRPSKEAYRGFLTMHLSSSSLINFATRLSNGARMPRVSWGDLAKYQVALPPVELAMKFNNVTRTLFDRILLNIETGHTLSELRDTLLPQLVSGKLRVHEAREVAEEAVV